MFFHIFNNLEDQIVKTSVSPSFPFSSLSFQSIFLRPNHPLIHTTLFTVYYAILFTNNSPTFDVSISSLPFILFHGSQKSRIINSSTNSTPAYLPKNKFFFRLLAISIGKSFVVKKKNISDDGARYSARKKYHFSINQFASQKRIMFMEKAAKTFHPQKPQRTERKRERKAHFNRDYRCF